MDEEENRKSLIAENAYHHKKNCPLCGCNETKILYEGLKDRFYGVDGTFAALACENCSFGFLDPVPSNLSQYYPDRYYSHRTSSAAFRLAKRLASSGLFHMPKAALGQRLLDIGCGNGEYLECMQKRGWSVCGIENNEQLLDQLHRGGFSVFQSIDSLIATAPPLFDLITLNSAIEHMDDFRTMLKKVRSLLKVGEEIVIIAPNFASREHHIFRSRWFHLDPPRHLWHFTPANLLHTLEESGFSNVRIKDIPCPTGFSGSIIYWLGLRFNSILFYLLMPLGYFWRLFVRDGIMRARAER